jgi:hypothetical protein
MAELTQERDYGIDLMKGILVVGMIVAHVIFLLADERRFPLNQIEFVINVVSFSGFLFCFGYAAQCAYFSKPLAFRRILTAAGRLLVAFYISAIGCELWVNQNRLDLIGLFGILTLFRVSLLSEFLLSFALTLLLSALLIRPIRYVLANPYRLLAACAALLATTFIPYGLIRLPQAGLLLGTTPDIFYAYPVVQYFPLFLLGMYFARQHVTQSRMLFICGLLGIGVFVVYQQVCGQPARFPPSLAWVLGSVAFVIVWYCVARWLTRAAFLRWLFVPIGANVLFYLLISNLTLFALTSSFRHELNSPVLCLAMAVVIITLIRYLVSLVRPTPRSIWQRKIA